ncbi:seven-hairpin glycosidase [Massarina eburnea CBS 473.64]|uniref:alpha-1,2-Mannosidase n=1 Tax=Massarina eburnea CBS 473.64 TaxID=1395130 RepID=A0A6A6S1X2_9PLEO|nr:seven-hairpin glycosidase [Massarina eburnea CBS 473.64]
MFRFRRYRIFIVFAVVVVFALYKFSSSETSWSAIERVRPGKTELEDETRVEWQKDPQVAQDSTKLEFDVPAAKSPQAEKTPPPSIVPVSRPVDEKPVTHQPKPTPAVGGGPDDGVQSPPKLGDLDPKPTPDEVIHWSKPTQHFPVPTESLIALPTAKPKSIPKIQFDFKAESLTDKVDRERKLNIIRSVFKRSWDGYRKNAWMQDELLPSSGGFRNPFAGWGATLVDSLDSLWIMGLEDEFDEAAKAVDKIDFTTTTRPDIPLFETTIRYMGGLLAAYDVSERKYKNLVVKAEELAEVLISAFDTPNRMPETYYYWRPDFSANPHRASNRAVLAEIGSLSMEFTRLAQITGKDKYYDAIARITDKLEEFQSKTRLPGMWPTYIDISGCKRIDYSKTYSNQKPIPPGKKPSIPPMKGDSVPGNTPLSADPKWAIDPDQPAESTKPQEDPRKDKNAPMVKPAIDASPPVPGEKLSAGGNKYIPLNLPSPLIVKPATETPGKKVSGLNKRQLGQVDDNEEKPVPFKAVATPTVETPTFKPAPNADADEDVEAPPMESRPVCEEIGFASPSEYSVEEYTLGGMSDSTYEYLPKEYLLLGGVDDRYRTMYEASVDTVKENLIFRPMLPNNEDILIAGKLHVPSKTVSGSTATTLEPQQEHLACFAGGMFGMGAKIFNRPDDLDVAIKLTEGCIYSYNMTASGIMPEGFQFLPCESQKNCEWNVTKYWDTLDPYAALRQDNYKEAMAASEVQYKLAKEQYDKEVKAMEAENAAPPPINDGISPEAVATPTPGFAAAAGAGSVLNKRQLGGVEEDAPAHSQEINEERKNAIGGHLGGIGTANSPTKVTPPTIEKAEDGEIATPSPSKPTPIFPAIYTPKAPMSQKEYVTTRIKEERLPDGVTRIGARSYILRPEAIESVWYMYRITGNAYYREAGWKMFEAINTATAAEWGNSAIEDVTQASPVLKDEMESFWLAETLKYFYLLFAQEDVLSLDEWVLNTEAHPFRRPT